MHRPSIRTSPCPKRLAELLAATAAKDQAAFAELYDTHQAQAVRHRPHGAAAARSRRGRDAGSLHPHLAQCRELRPGARTADHLDGDDRAQPRDRREALAGRRADRQFRAHRDPVQRAQRAGRTRGERRPPPPARSDEDARSDEAQAGDRRLHQWREPRAVEPALRRAGQHDQDLAAPRRARHPRRDRGGGRRAASGWPGARPGPISCRMALDHRTRRDADAGLSRPRRAA